MRRSTESRIWIAGLVGLALAGLAGLAGCSAEAPGEKISPQPQPVLGIDVDETRISVTDIGAMVLVHGEPGSLGAGPGTVEIRNLSLPSSTASGDFAANGSFELSLTGEPTDTFRLDAANAKNQQGSTEFTADPKSGQVTQLADN